MLSLLIQDYLRGCNYAVIFNRAVALNTVSRETTSAVGTDVVPMLCVGDLAAASDRAELMANWAGGEVGLKVPVVSDGKVWRYITCDWLLSPPLLVR